MEAKLAYAPERMMSHQQFFYRFPWELQTLKCPPSDFFAAPPTLSAHKEEDRAGPKSKQTPPSSCDSQMINFRFQMSNSKPGFALGFLAGITRALDPGKT